MMLLKMYVRSCHSSVQNPPVALHLRAKVKGGPWLQGLYNLHHTHSPSYTSLTMYLCTFASAHFCSLTNILNVLWLHQAYSGSRAFAPAVPCLFSQRAIWLAPSPTLRSLYTWHLLNSLPWRAYLKSQLPPSSVLPLSLLMGRKGGEWTGKGERAYHHIIITHILYFKMTKSLLSLQSTSSGRLAKLYLLSYFSFCWVKIISSTDAKWVCLLLSWVIIQKWK